MNNIKTYEQFVNESNQNNVSLSYAIDNQSDGSVFYAIDVDDIVVGLLSDPSDFKNVKIKADKNDTFSSGYYEVIKGSKELKSYFNHKSNIEEVLATNSSLSDGDKV